MSLRIDDQLLAAVAAALGETLALVRSRGFHLERVPGQGATQPNSEQARRRGDDDDAVDLERYGIDWDADDGRGSRRRRGATAPRGPRRAA